MVKILFAGPSLHACTIPNGIQPRPPAAQGDLQDAVLHGANVIGLVDGLFETVPAVWHKEILFALANGVKVLGAASLGALRAVECEPFGMIVVGDIARAYADGRLDDDAAVAQLHAPAELGFQPVTLALVDCPPAIQALRRAGLVDETQAASLLAAANALFFKHRTWPAILHKAGLSGPVVAQTLCHLKNNDTSIKRRDALSLLKAMLALPDRRAHPNKPLHVQPTRVWQRTLDAAIAKTKAQMPAAQATKAGADEPLQTRR